MLKGVLGLVLCVLTAGTAAAQPFGRNKVHYDDLDFRVLVTPHFDIYYYPAEHAATLQAARMAERRDDWLSTALHHQFSERQPIVFYGSHAQFAQTNVVPGFLPDGVGGVTEHDRGRLVLPFAAGLGETDHVLGHELVHAFQRDILRASGRSLALLPLWFVEGMAEDPVDRPARRQHRDVAAGCRRPAAAGDRSPGRCALLSVPLRSGALGLPGRPFRRRSRGGQPRGERRRRGPHRLGDRGGCRRADAGVARVDRRCRGRSAGGRRRGGFQGARHGRRRRPIERRAFAQPRRQLARVPLRARPVFD